jgi:hypothetical protein
MILAPLIAWFLAKSVGNAGGLKNEPLLFGVLFVVSGFGVFNTLMLNAEGGAIFRETIAGARDRFEAVGDRAAAELGRGGSNSPLAHLQRVETLKASLYSEIRNPLNCGQGPEARKIVADLQAELPNFRPLSSTKVDCSHNAQVIDDYDARISALVDRAPWSNTALQNVFNDAVAARKELVALATVADQSSPPTLLQTVAPQLESKAAQYRELVDKLPKQDDSAVGLPKNLDLVAIESLGKTSQSFNVIFGRLNKFTTYLYLIVAFLFDFIMVHMFMRIRRLKVRRAESGSTGSAISRGIA